MTAKLLASAGIVTAIVAFGTTALAEPDPNACHGQIVGQDIASTWPFAHEDRDEFQPPPGAVALFTQELTGFDNAGEFNAALREECGTGG